MESLQTNSIARASLCARCQSDTGLTGSLNGLRVSVQQTRCVYAISLVCFWCAVLDESYDRVQTCCEAVGCDSGGACSSDSSSSVAAEGVLEPVGDLSCVGTMAAVAVLHGPDFCHPDFVTFLASDEVSDE